MSLFLNVKLRFPHLYVGNTADRALNLKQSLLAVCREITDGRRRDFCFVFVGF